MSSTEWKNLPEEKEDAMGFVYLIRNNHPDSDKKYYIGKKQLLKRLKRKPLKGKKRNRISYVDNKVDDYWGSSKQLLEDMEKYGIEHFSREVIEMCGSKFHMSYAELEWQMKCNALMDDKFYNGVLNIRLGVVPKNYVDIKRDPSILNL